MQTDQSSDSATATTRRTFLTRTAVGGALVTAGALALPVSTLAPSAGARTAEQGKLKDAVFAHFGTGLELAAVGAYRAAFDKDVLDDEWSRIALQFQSHHQAVADTLIELVDPDDPEPVAEAALTNRGAQAMEGATTQEAVLNALAEIEEICAATHLKAIGQLAEKSTARTVAQVLAVEGQQAAILAVGGGTAIAEVTPATNSGDAALTIPTSVPQATTTTTAAAGSGDATTSTSSDATTTSTAN